jgi:hypothetical protein
MAVTTIINETNPQPQVRIFKKGEEPDDIFYWLSSPPIERIRALEEIRQQYNNWKYGTDSNFKEFIPLLNVNGGKSIFYFVPKILLMQRIEIKKGMRVSTEEFLDSVSRLDPTSLNVLLERVQNAIYVQNQPTNSGRESQLLTDIRTIVPAAVVRRFRQLRLKQQNGTLVTKEQEEMQLLADILEEKSAERVLLLGELASLRKVTLQELRKQIRLQDFYA